MESIKLSEIKVAHYQVWSIMAEETFRKLKADIKINGVIFPLIVDENFTLLDGHHRYKAAKESGLESVPVIVKSNLTEDEKLEIAYKLNSTVRVIGKTEKQRKARELHAEGRSYRQIATWLGVGKSTIQRWVVPEVERSVPSGTAKQDDGKLRQDTDTIEQFGEMERQIAELSAKVQRLERENVRLQDTDLDQKVEISRLKLDLAMEKMNRTFSGGKDNGMRIFAHMVGLSDSASPTEIRRAFRKAQAKAHPDSHDREWVSTRYNTAAEVFTELYG